MTEGLADRVVVSTQAKPNFSRFQAARRWTLTGLPMTENFICPQVDLATAQHHLERRPGWRWRAALNAVRSIWNRPSTLRPRHLELVWLPYYQVTFQSASSDNAPPTTMDLLIDGHDRRPVFWDLASVRWESGKGREHFQPSFDIETARAVAKRALFDAGLRGNRWRRSTVSWNIRQIRTVHYPYWVAYYERRHRRIDIVMLDALTAQIAGPANKIALLAALAQSKAENTRDVLGTRGSN